MLINAAGEITRTEIETIELANNTQLVEIDLTAKHLTILFPSFMDGRGLTLAKKLRQAGFKGVLRAKGAVIADQFRYLLQVGFDEIEVNDTIAARQPASQWLQAKGSYDENYQGGYGHASILETRHGLEARLTSFRRRIIGKIIFTTSFGLEDQAITHCIFTQNLDIDVVTLDTGRLFPETLQVWQETENKYGKRIHAAQPSSQEVSQHLNENGINGIFQFAEVRKDCCAIRKIRPLQHLLKNAQGWVTGVRAASSHARAATPLSEFDTSFNIEKLNPLFDFSRERLENYIATHKVPVNSLHAQGFPSIGCAPCTRAIAPHEDERAGRWWWENDAAKECGLHAKEQRA